MYVTTNPKHKNTHPNIHNYIIEGILGVGAYGKVKLASHELTKEKVAIKFVDKTKLIKQNDIKRMKREMKIISEVNHPNILKAIEIFEDERFYYIVMEQPTKGDLFNHICSKKRLSLTEATFMFYQIVNAIEYIHKIGIVHRDIKPENFMLTEDMIIKLGDFGLSSNHTIGNKLKTICGSPVYSAPEMIKGKSYDPISVDIWGLGIILYIMQCGQLPFEDNNIEELYVKIMHCDYNFPYYCNANCKALIKRILIPNAQDRISLEEIKESNVYMTGKANFLRKFKIYDYDGTILPQVNSYIKKQTLIALKECSVIINKDIIQSPAYLVFFYKILHKTNWENYHIPINSLTERAIEVVDSNSNTITSNSPKNNSKETHLQKKITFKNRIHMDGLLMIRSHSSLTECLIQKYPVRKNDPPIETYKEKSPIRQINHSPTNITMNDNISFNKEGDVKSKQMTFTNINITTNSNNLQSHPNPSEIPLKSMNRSSSAYYYRKTNKSQLIYTEKDYEKDIEYLHKKGYKKQNNTQRDFLNSKNKFYPHYNS